MKVIKCTINKLPIEEIKEIKPEWISEIEKVVHEYIKATEEQIVAEAEFEGNEDFLDEKKLYEHFKDVKENEMWFGMWEILKYFIMYMNLKACKLILGDWTFTDNDKEMYNYFSTVKVNDNTKCKPSLLKLKSGAKLSYNSLLYNYNNYEINYEFDTDDSYNTSREPFFIKFIKLFDSIENMAKNCKMLQKYGTFNIFEQHDILYGPYLKNDIEKYTAKKIKKISSEKILSNTEKSFCIDKISITNTFCNEFYNEFCQKNKEYRKMQEDFTKLQHKLFEEYKKSSPFYKSLTDEYKLSIEQIINAK